MYRSFPFVAVFLVLFLFPSLSIGGESSISNYLKAGELEESGNYPAAAEIIRGMLKTEKSAYLYTKLIELLIASSDGDAAINVLLEAEKAFPTDPYFKFTLGQIYEFHKRDIDGAYKHYMAAAKLSPDSKYRLATSRMLEASGKYKEAIAVIDELISEKQLAQYYSDKGRIYQRMGDMALAIENLKKAVAMDDDMPAMLRLADIHLSEGKTEEAKKMLERISSKGESLILPELKLSEIYRNEKDFAKAIQLYSQVADKLEGKDRAAVLKQMGSVQYEMGDYDNASRTFEWVTELTPEDSRSAYFAGYIYEYLGKNAKAREIYEKALKLHPDYAQLLKRMAVLDVIEGKSDEALANLKKINSVERDVYYYMLTSEAYSRKKEHGKAVIALVEGLNENPTDTDILYSLANQYEMLKERNRAVETIKKALAVEPDNHVFQNFLGYVYADMGVNLTEAKELIEKALSKEPLNPAYLDSMAWVLFKMKKYKSALEYMEKAIKSMPDDPEMKEHIKAIKEKLK